MEYHVTKEYHNAEFGFSLYPGDVIFDGDIEPDLMANLVAAGVVEAPKASDNAVDKKGK